MYHTGPIGGAGIIASLSSRSTCRLAYLFLNSVFVIISINQLRFREEYTWGAGGLYV